MELSNLSPELQQKVRECTSIEELSELCASENIKLSEDELEGLAGGFEPLNPDNFPCPKKALCPLHCPIFTPCNDKFFH